ncbi:MAG: NAD(P)-dependent oxidoreductase [Verrucomicrobia bacterium]|nr:NAD(P)-dependent oxidoreductase [Verrucomicrobiota bacterium]
MPRTFRKNVGVLGLGIIGRRIADHLRHQGLSVFVWNRTPRPVPNFVGSPSELAQTCNYLQIFVSNDDALMRMIQVITPSLTPRHVIIPHATVSPDTMREAAALVQRRGARLLEAPFTGSKMAAEKGQLVYYAGGDEETLREVRPLLEASSKAILHIGDVGHASIIKVATNLVTAAEVQAAAEAMGLVHYAGIPLEKFAEAMKHNGSNSATLEMKIPAIMNTNFEPHFAVKHMLKDMQIANRLGRQFELDLGMASAARDRLLDEVRQGHGEEDYSSVSREFLPFVQSSSADQLQPDLFAQLEAESTPAEPPDLLEDEEEPMPEPDFIERQMAQLEPITVAQPHTYGAIELPPAEPLAPRHEEEEVAEITLPEAPKPSRETAPPVAGPREHAPNHLHPPPEEKRGGFFSRFLGRSADY